MNVERIWAVLATVGFVISLALTADVVADSRWLRWARLNGARAIVARLNLREALFASVVQGLFAALGWTLLLLPFSRERWLGLSAHGWAIVVFLFAAELLLIVGSVWNLVDRHALLERKVEEEKLG